MNKEICTTGELYDLCAHLCGFKDGEWSTEEIEAAMAKKFGEFDMDSFAYLIGVLVPLIDVAESPLTGTKYKGFAVPVNAGYKAMRWLVKMEV